MEDSAMYAKEVDFAKLLSKRATETLQAASKSLTESSAAGALARGHVFELCCYYEQAAESYRRAGTDEATARLAIVQMKDGKPEQALHTAMSVTARNPGLLVRELTSDEQVSAMTILGDALASNNRHADAVEAYLAARKNSSKDSFAAGRLAQVYLASAEPKKALELGEAFAGNPRFQSLSSVLALGKMSDALLPVIKPDTLTAVLRRTMVGRPILVDGLPLLASVVEGDEHWCSPVPNEVEE